MLPEEHVRSYSTAHDKKLKTLCEPLESLGIDTFWYYTLSESGEFTYIGNQGLIAEYFYQQRLFTDHPYFKSPQLLKSGVFLADDDIETYDKQTPMRDQHSLNQLFMVCEKEGGVMHGYGFATMQNLPSLTNTYINYLTLLKKFIRYFKRETNPLLKKIYDNRTNIGQLIGESFYTPSPQDLGNPSELITMLNKKMELSSREFQCLSLLTKGYSAKMIGQHLGLSKRTVEHYIENTKNKLGCINKYELINAALDLQLPLVK